MGDRGQAAPARSNASVAFTVPRSTGTCTGSRSTGKSSSRARTCAVIAAKSVPSAARPSVPSTIDQQRARAGRARQVDVEEEREEHEQRSPPRRSISSRLPASLPDVDGGLVAGREQERPPSSRSRARPGSVRPRPEQRRSGRSPSQSSAGERRRPAARGPAPSANWKTNSSSSAKKTSALSVSFDAPLDEHVLPRRRPARVGRSSRPPPPRAARRAAGRRRRRARARGVSSATRPPARMATRSATSSSRPKLCVAMTIGAARSLERLRGTPPATSSPADRGRRTARRAAAPRGRARAEPRQREPALHPGRERAHALVARRRSSSTSASAARSRRRAAGCPLSVAQKRRFSSAVRSS